MNQISPTYPEIPCDVVTGFLGSGKTSLLRYVLEHGLGGRRVAILMNEIGDIGIDGPTISDLDGIEAMVELNSGCVCCSIDEFSFATAYQQVVDEIRPELVIIETTGLADPAPVLARLDGVGASHDAVITLVDAANFDTHSANHPVLRQQVAAADFLVVNKIDLVDAADLAALERKLVAINPVARRIQTRQGRVPMELLFATGAARARTAGATTQTTESTFAAHEGNDLHDHGVESFSFKSGPGIELERFRCLMENLPSQIYRAKGLLDFGSNEPPIMFNYVCGRLTLEALPALCARSLGTQAVFIGPGVGSLRDVTIDALQQCIPVQKREPYKGDRHDDKYTSHQS